MRTRFADLTVRLGGVELFGTGWYFQDSTLNGADEFGWTVVPLVDNGAFLEDAGGASGAREYVFCKDFPTVEAAQAEYERLHAAVAALGDSALVVEGSYATQGQDGGGPDATLVPGYSFSLPHAAVQRMGYTVEMMPAGFRLSVNYSIVYIR